MRMLQNKKRSDGRENSNGRKERMALRLSFPIWFCPVLAYNSRAEQTRVPRPNSQFCRTWIKSKSIQMAHFPTKTLPGLALLGIAEKRRRSKKNTNFVIRCEVRVVYSHVVTLYQKLRWLLAKMHCDIPIVYFAPTEICQSMLYHTGCLDLAQHARTLARPATLAPICYFRSPWRSVHSLL